MFKSIFDVILTVHRRSYVEIKCQLDATEVFIADLIACSTCFGHNYAHQKELKSIIHCKKPTKNTHTRPSRHSTHHITNLDNTRHLILRTQILRNLILFLHLYSTKYHRQQPLYNTLELLMMGIVVSETC